ncbi:hypothetical protein WN943_018947 [Citrus x changshan-huyou]
MSSDRSLESFRPYTLTQTLNGHLRAVSYVKFSHDGRLLTSSSAEKTLLTYSLSSISNFDSTPPSPLQKFTGHEQGISDLATIRLWDVPTATSLKTLIGHTNYVFCINFNPQSNRIVSDTFNETIRIWDIKTGKCLKVLPAHSDLVTAIDFNRDGTMIVTSSYDGLYRILDASTPNGKFILVGTLDNTLRLWNYSTRKILKTYSGYTNSKYCISSTFSTRKVVQKLEGHRDPVISVASHPAKNIIASGALDNDRTMKIWTQEKE